MNPREMILLADGRRHALADWLTPPIEEAAAIRANEWIKGLRHARSGGRTLRDRLTYRGDSLWWFVEIYLHKRGTIAALFRMGLALEALIAETSAHSVEIAQGDHLLSTLVAAMMRGRGRGPTTPETPAEWRRRIDRQSWQWMALACGARLKPGRMRLDRSRRHPMVAGYVHSAFWRRAPGSEGEEGEEGYVGPVVSALEERLGVDAVTLVGVGPSTNFRARRWWHPFRVSGAAAPFRVVPIEAYAPLGALADSLALWRRRAELAEVLTGPEVRDAARLLALDLWAVVEEELYGAALLQLPWSARAMDEAAASLDELSPTAVFTYAEAGGWGRALVLEARRRGIASVGVQHGFIYRHWLNYQHESDEMSPSDDNPLDRGFPRPDTTLLYDGFAAAHLEGAGAFPATALDVTGSPTLDRLVVARAGIDAAAMAAARTLLGLRTGDRVVAVVSKHSQIGDWLRPLVDAAEAVPGLVVVIKPHPAETAEPYRDVCERAHVRLAPASIDLTMLLVLARVVVTVHSTVAIDALALGVPSLVVGAATNLQPFVDAGAMLGAWTSSQVPDRLAAIVDDERVRREVAESASRFLERYGIRSDGRASARAAEAIVAHATGATGASAGVGVPGKMVEGG
ncbi:MAG: hypothetical protein U0Q12_06610 [Vicinamibacterales bacterium]